MKLKIKSENELPFLKFQKRFFLSALLAFLVDIMVFTLLRPLLGINFSASIAFLISQITLFLVSNLFFNKRIKSIKKGVALQILIGIGSLLINLLVLNGLDLLIYNLYTSSYLVFGKSYLVSFLMKIISGIFGYAWTSTMVNKLLFK